MKIVVPKLKDGAYVIDPRALRITLESDGELALFQLLMPYVEQSGYHVARQGSVGVITPWKLSEGDAAQIFNDQ